MDELYNRQYGSYENVHYYECWYCFKEFKQCGSPTPNEFKCPNCGEKNEPVRTEREWVG